MILQRSTGELRKGSDIQRSTCMHILYVYPYKHTILNPTGQVLSHKWPWKRTERSKWPLKFVKLSTRRISRRQKYRTTHKHMPTAPFKLHSACSEKSDGLVFSCVLSGTVTTMRAEFRPTFLGNQVKSGQVLPDWSRAVTVEGCLFF